MDGGYERIAAAAHRLAGRLPAPLLHSLADAIRSGQPDPWPTLQVRVATVMPHALYRTLASEFIATWRVEAAGLSPDAIALALMTAAQAEAHRRADQTVELVWTGPESGTSPFRRTEQAILQVLDSASRRVILVSYAVYNVPRIAESLVRAAARGVRITTIVESPDRNDGQGAYSTLKALGEDVAACSTVYLWPREQRKQAENGRVGSLHVKCAVADGRVLFLSSANLTEYAFSLNMELGLLVTGRHLPGQVEAHFDRLIEERILTALSPDARSGSC
jgi:phosphatidylserine/phosphatidylglycerophosphate/cardiolipin synthase-like enzyme